MEYLAIIINNSRILYSNTGFPDTTGVILEDETYE